MTLPIIKVNMAGIRYAGCGITLWLGRLAGRRPKVHTTDGLKQRGHLTDLRRADRVVLSSLSVRELIVELADTETVLGHARPSAPNADPTDPVVARTLARQHAILAELHQRCGDAAPAIPEDEEPPVTTPDTDRDPAPAIAPDELKELERLWSYLGAQCFPADREELLQHGVCHHAPPALLQLLTALPEHRTWPDLTAVLRDLGAAVGEGEHP